jgi:hypothetical protein
MEIKVGEIYKHYKGTFVKVVALCKHTETLEDMIAYIHVNNSSKKNTDPNLFFSTDDRTVWVRPKSMWFDKVKDGETTRFTLVEKENSSK